MDSNLSASTSHSTSLSNSLSQTFGFDEFRPGQEQTISQLLNGDSSLSIFPTGSGKSLCYQLTALHLPHLTLLVSPLLALMKDQLEFLAQKGIEAASIDSTLTPEQNQQVMAGARSGKIKILMVSVERFKNERFRRFIMQVPVSMLVVDEAHCISEWGHNFRPDYLKLPAYRKALNIPLVLLLTATATKKVKKDMAQKFNIAEQHIVQTGFYRDNLDLSVVPVLSDDKNKKLLQLILLQQGPGIIYVTLQKTAEQVAEFLQNSQIDACAYHAGFDDENRKKIQTNFMNNKTQIVVATIAFGMGIDKANIRFVVHYDLPKSIENYSQEIGRAGRDGLVANCITLANLDGVHTLENFAFGDTPEHSGIEFVLNNIRQETENGQWELQLVSLSNLSNVRQLPLKTLLVQLELLGVLQPMYSYFANFRFKFLKSRESILAMFKGERRMFLETVFEHSPIKKVWGSPDFEALFQNYSCDRDRVVTALDYLQQKQLIELETKRMTEVFRVDQQALSVAGLAEELHLYFTEKEQKEVKRIATLVRFFELDRCLSHNLSLYFDDQQSPVSCGHCSVCRGQVARLEYSKQSTWPTDRQLTDDLNHFTQVASDKIKQPLSLESCCRFLAGINLPLFRGLKVKSLSGFGCCENFRYEEIRNKVQTLWEQLG